MYGHALETYTNELDRVDASIDSIRKGKFLKALLREELKQDRDWVIRLRTLPETPETYYLMELMASHDFQTALSNYLDLEDLRTRLVSWETSFDAFEDIIGLRKQNYDPLLPEVDAEFRELDSQIRLRMEQREHLDKRLQGMLTAPRPDYLATADERIVSERLDQLERQLIDPASPQEPALRQRIAHVRGALTWRLRTEYHERLTEAHTHLNELNVVIAAMTERYQSLVRTRQAATHSYVGYDVPINQLRRRVGEALQKVNRLMARQGHLLETVAINELKARRERLDAYQTQARFAVADSYDRAARLQADVRPDGAQAGSVESGDAQPAGAQPGGGQQ